MSSEEGAKSMPILWILFDSLEIQVFEKCSSLPKHRCINQVHEVNHLNEKEQDTHLITGFQDIRHLKSWHKSYRRPLYSEEAAVDEFRISKDNSTIHLCEQNSNQTNCCPRAFRHLSESPQIWENWGVSKVEQFVHMQTPRFAPKHIINFCHFENVYFGSLLLLLHPWMPLQ